MYFVLSSKSGWNTTFACSLFVFLYYNWHGLRAHGLGHIAHMANPAGTSWGWFLSPLMFPIEIVSHIDPSVPENVIGDPVRLKQVITNLVANAIKFTSHGEVSVTVTEDERTADTVILHFAVNGTMKIENFNSFS